MIYQRMNQGMIYQRMNQGMIYQRMNQGMIYHRMMNQGMIYHRIMNQGMIYQRTSQGMIYQMMFNQEKDEAFPILQADHCTNVAVSPDTRERTVRQKSMSASQIRVRMAANAWTR
jgi:hypothetical protein